MCLGQEITATGEGFQIEELIFLQPRHGFHVALVGMRGGRNAHMLAVPESLGEAAFELTTVAPQERGCACYRVGWTSRAEG